MRKLIRTKTAIGLIGCSLVFSTVGCQGRRLAREIYEAPSSPTPLGTLSDDIWQNQEVNAEAADFIVHQHEFQQDSLRLNTGGEDHIKQIAARLRDYDDFPIVVERSMMTPREDTEFKYPVHPNVELDLNRRLVVVKSLVALGIDNADELVVVAPTFAPGIKGTEAERAYLQGLSSGFGGGFGGGLGGGFGGGFGGQGSFGGFQ